VVFRRESRPIFQEVDFAMLCFRLSITISLVSFAATWAIFAVVLGIEPRPVVLLFMVWLAVPYLACGLGAWMVRFHRVAGLFAVLSCIGTAARGLSVPIAMMSQRRDAQDGLVLVFLPIYQFPVTALLLVVTAIAALASKPRRTPTFHADEKRMWDVDGSSGGNGSERSMDADRI